MTIRFRRNNSSLQFADFDIMEMEFPLQELSVFYSIQICTKSVSLVRKGTVCIMEKISTKRLNFHILNIKFQKNQMHVEIESKKKNIFL